MSKALKGSSEPTLEDLVFEKINGLIKTSSDIKNLAEEITSL